MTESKRRVVISAFLAGACLGAGLALMLAPQTGSQLRGTIRDSAHKTGEELAHVWEKVREEGNEYVESGKTMLKRTGAAMESAVDRGKEYAEAGRATVKRVATALKESLHD